MGHRQWHWMPTPNRYGGENSWKEGVSKVYMVCDTLSCCCRHVFRTLRFRHQLSVLYTSDMQSFMKCLGKGA